MYHLIAFQVFCGLFCAFLAARSGHSRLFWGLVGCLVPVAGVGLCLHETRRALRPPSQPANRIAGTGGDTRKRPERCCGRYIPECWGCPHFRRRLFGGAAEGSKGRCAFFGRDLRADGTVDSGESVKEDP
jgi:hypothetical protein